jgi:ribosome-binding protein aMBF1 (putative translation factor)
MTRTKWAELRDARLSTFTDEQRAEYDRAYRAAALVASIGEQIRAFREEASLTQRDLAERMGTSQAAIARTRQGVSVRRLRRFSASPTRSDWRLPLSYTDLPRS